MHEVADGYERLMPLADAGCWSHCIAHYHTQQKADLRRYQPADQRELDLWATLARSTGWWRPGHGLCVMAKRRVAMLTEPAPGARDGQLWVITGPDSELIRREPNDQVRRSAIEQIGWDTCIDAGLSLVATCPDPGNPGAWLRLQSACPPGSMTRL